MPLPLSPRFSHLSAARQALVRLCQSTNYGHIRNIEVRDREPVFTSPQCVVLVDIKLDSEDRPRYQADGSDSDFLLCAEIVRLMALLDNIQNGKIARLEIRAGLARRIVWERRAMDWGGASA